MKMIPEFLQNVIHENTPELLVWFSDHVYEHLCLTAEEHPLIQLENLLDLRAAEAACAGYHQTNGQGRPVEHTVRQLLRALLVRYLYALSLRQTEARIRFDMVCKWFVGYQLAEAGPDHSRIQSFEAWLLVEQPRLFFDTVLKQIDAAFPQQRGDNQFGDTFALLANAQREGRTARIRHASRLLLAALKKENSAAYERVLGQLDEAKLWGPPAEKGVYKLTDAARRTRRRQAGQAACRLLQGAVGEAGGPRTKTQAGLLHCVLEQIFGPLDEAADGTLSLPKKKKKSQAAGPAICSVTDPEATVRKHGEDKIDFGYNAAVLTTTHFVREIEARPGSEHDSVSIVPLLESQAEQHALWPAKLIYDQAAGTGKVAAAVDQASQGGTQLVVNPLDYSERTETFSPQDFSLSADGSQAICPAGQQSSCRYRASAGDGWVYRFYANVCRGCQDWDRCRQKPEKVGTKRDVYVSDYQVHHARLVAYAATDDFAQEMASRGHVERVIALLTRYNGARYARFRGRAKVDFQLKMCAAAYNLKRWLALRRQKEKPPRQTSPPPAPAALVGATA